MITSYYIWNWADNDLPGKPNEVFAELMAGRMPHSLQPFNASAILRRIERLALRDRSRGKEWDWQVQPDKATGKARFVYVAGPKASFDILAPTPHLGEQLPPPIYPAGKKPSLTSPAPPKTTSSRDTLFRRQDNLYHGEVARQTRKS